ncbi:MAG: glycosyl transferase [Parachlamydiales bacterium]|nr:glycosyl transferase [Parachlamydiales bacterium]
MTRVLIGSPIRQKPLILHEFLESLCRLEKKNYELDFLFIDDNEQSESKNLLNRFPARCTIQQPDIFSSGAKYVCNETTHHWKDSIIWKVAQFKDRIIQSAREQDYDYLFFIDSDIVLHPRTIDQLIKANKEIVSNIFWTQWMPDQVPLPQVWVSDHYTLFERGIQEQITQAEASQRQRNFLERLRRPGVYEVGGLGACTLISRSALTRPINFQRIRNISFWGEDRHFCIRAAALGIGLYVDTHYPAYHIYRDSDLSGVEEFKKHAT